MSQVHPMPERIFDAHNHVRRETCAKLLASMDQANVEMALVMGTYRVPNAELVQCVRDHPDRLVAGIYADPRQGARAIDEIKHYHAEGVRIVKLFPNLGYYPDDDAWRLFFDAIAELKMAVLSHCGWLSPKAGVTAAYYSHPGRFEKLVRRYGETIFIFAHMGGIAGFLETVMLTTRTPNSYVDCAPGQGTWVLENAGPMAATVPPDRLMWGADGCEHATLIARSRKAMEACGLGPHLQKIFYSNPRGLLERIGAIPTGARSMK